MVKKIKDLTSDEMWAICKKYYGKCEKSHDKCKGCPLKNKRNNACAKHYPDTLYSKFSPNELDKEIELEDIK